MVVSPPTLLIYWPICIGSDVNIICSGPNLLYYVALQINFVPSGQLFILYTVLHDIHLFKLLNVFYC